jgi:hypothetical protein
MQLMHMLTMEAMPDKYRITDRDITIRHG